MGAWRIAAVLAALAAYAVASHLLMVHWPAAPWTVALLFGPLLAGIAAGGWVRRHWPTLALCAALVAGIAWITAHGGVADVKSLYVLQHAALHLTLAWSFGITLRPGATPLITALAERIHEHFPPGHRGYTRRLTQVWVGYFVGMVGLSLLIYAFAPWPWWSIFANVLTPLAVGALFLADTAWRRWRHPEFERVQIGRVIQAWRRHGAPAAR